MKKLLLSSVLAVCLISSGVVFAKDINKLKERGQITFQVVQSQLVLTPDKIEKVSVTRTQNNYPAVNVQLTPQAAKEMASISKDNIGKHLNIVWNNKLISSPVIESSLPGSFEITGFNIKQAKHFVRAINKLKQKS